MKEIQPLNGFWLNGQFVSAVFLKFNLGFDDLESQCMFYYEFLSEKKTMLANGNLIMTGETYLNWDGSNTSAWDFAVSQLGFILAKTK